MKHLSIERHGLPHLMVIEGNKINFIADKDYLTDTETATFGWTDYPKNVYSLKKVEERPAQVAENGKYPNVKTPFLFRFEFTKTKQQISNEEELYQLNN